MGQVSSHQVSAADIAVDDAAFAYLREQKGKLAPLAGRRPAWLAAYRAALDQDYRLIKPHLPPAGEHAVKLLDVGSGLGGIDVLLHRHYAGTLQPILLDGVADAPAMRLHRETFNSMAVAEAFQRANGAGPIGWIDPRQLPLAAGSVRWPFDLVISLGSWCFHYAPEVYLDFVAGSVRRPGGVVILDVRRSRPEWAAQLQRRFTLRTIVHCSAKFDRMVFHAA